MTGIKVQSRDYDPRNDFFQEAQAYLIKVGDQWFRVEHLTQPLFDVETESKYSSNAYKWRSYGQSHRFIMEKCSAPEETVSSEVQRFVEHHLSSGCTEATLEIFHEGCSYIPPGAKEGWK
jgi:hypothetical protein